MAPEEDAFIRATDALEFRMNCADSAFASLPEAVQDALVDEYLRVRHRKESVEYEQFTVRFELAIVEEKQRQLEAFKRRRTDADGYGARGWTRKLSDTPLLYSAKKLKEKTAKPGVDSPDKAARHKLPSRKASDGLAREKVEKGLDTQNTRSWFWRVPEAFRFDYQEIAHYWFDQESFDGCFHLQTGEQEPLCADECATDAWGESRNVGQCIAAALSGNASSKGWMAVKSVGGERMRLRHMRAQQWM